MECRYQDVIPWCHTLEFYKTLLNQIYLYIENIMILSQLCDFRNVGLISAYYLIIQEGCYVAACYCIETIWSQRL